jgi:single-strand DNA-binding protein
MASDVNEIEVIGRLGKEPELTFTPDGKPVIRGTCASSRRFQSGGEWKEDTTWFNWTYWPATIEIANATVERFVKGQRVRLTGEMRCNKWTSDDGVKHTNWYIHVYRIQNQDVKRDKESEGEAEPTTATDGEL